MPLNAYTSKEEEMLSVLAIVASCLIIASYASYIRAVARGETPNLVGITIVFCLVLGNVVTYQQITSLRAQVFTWAQLVCSSIAMAVAIRHIRVYGFEVVKRKIALHWADGVIMLAVLSSMLVWKLTTRSVLANIIVQAANLISFTPFIKVAYRGAVRMDPIPWLLGFTAYSIQFMVAWPDGAIAMIFPAVGMIGHGMVFTGTVLYKKGSDHGVDCPS